LAACVLASGSHGQGTVEDRLALCDARTGKVLRRWSDSGKPSPSWLEHLVFSRDGRLLASPDANTVHVWEVATGKEVRTFRGHRGEIPSLAFSANGRRLASGSTDSTVLLWELGPASRPAEPPGEKEVAACWDDLSGADAARAYDAIWRLAEAPAASVPFLRQHLRPVTEAEVKEISRFIEELGSDEFAAREQATRQLERLGPAAAPALRKALEKGAPLEVRRRIERLLEGLGGQMATGEPLRTLRALAALEHANTAEARRLLQELAAGAAGAWLTQEAKAVCERLPPRVTP
jgi:hypothetical protein